MRGLDLELMSLLFKRTIESSDDPTFEVSTNTPRNGSESPRKPDYRFIKTSIPTRDRPFPANTGEAVDT